MLEEVEVFFSGCRSGVGARVKLEMLYVEPDRSRVSLVYLGSIMEWNNMEKGLLYEMAGNWTAMAIHAQIWHSNECKTLTSSESRGQRW